MTIKAIIFDMGQVLDAPNDPEEAEARRAELAKMLGIDPSELWTYLFEGDASKKWMTGQITEHEFWNSVLGPNGINNRDEMEAFARKTFADTGTLNHEMAVLLKELRGRYKLAVLSNVSWNESKLTRLLYNEMGIPEGTFDEIIASSSVGVTKPDPRIYLHTLERLEVGPEEAIFTDDLESFTRAAAALGIHAHTFTTPAGLRAYLEEMAVLPTAAERIALNAPQDDRKQER